LSHRRADKARDAGYNCYISTHAGVPRRFCAGVEAV
jgi:hypothetical protein